MGQYPASGVWHRRYTLAGIIDKWERLKELAAQTDVSIRDLGLTEFDDYKRSFVARMFNITLYRLCLTL